MVVGRDFLAHSAPFGLGCDLGGKKSQDFVHFCLLIGRSLDLA